MEYVAYAILFYGFIKVAGIMHDIGRACDEAMTEADPSE